MSYPDRWVVTDIEAAGGPEVVLHVLAHAQKRLGRGGRYWAKGAHTRLRESELHFCAIGALHVTAGSIHERQAAHVVLLQSMTRQQRESFGGVMRMNDDPVTTWPDIRKLYRRAINKMKVMVEKQGGS